MNNNGNNNDMNAEEVPQPVKKRSVWKRVLKWTAITVCSIIALLLVAVTLVVWILTPPKLTRLVEEYGSEYLNADLRAERVELTFWSTFPHLTLEVDSLSLTARDVPEEYGDVAGVSKLSGTVNLLALLKYSVELKDLYVNGVRAKYVVFEDGKTNLDFLPSSEEEQKEKGSVPPPSISFNRFIIEDAGPIRYISLTDSTDVAINIANVTLNGEGMPEYMLSVRTDNSLRNRLLALDSLKVGLDGNIIYDLRNPESLELRKMRVEVDSFATDFTTRLHFGDTLTVSELEFKLPDWRLSRAVELLPEQYGKAVKDVTTDLSFTLEGKLNEPYRICLSDTTSSAPVPDMTLDVNVPSSELTWKRLHLQRIELAARIKTDPAGADRTVVDIERLIVAAKNIGFGIRGVVRTPLSNPSYDGIIKGGINLTDLPSEIYTKFASDLNGKIDTDVRLRASVNDFKPGRFHRIYLEGKVDLRGVEYISADTLTRLFTDSSELHFGSNIKYVNNSGAVADSLLSVSVKGDSLWLRQEETRMFITGYTVGAGTKVMKNRADSTIVPLGGVVRFERLRLEDPTDSISFTMRDATCNASVTTYEGDNRKPLIKLVFDNRFLYGGVPSGKVGLRGSHIDLTATFRERKARNSNGASVRRPGHISPQDEEETEQIDMEVDSGMRKLLDRWNIRGTIKAEAGRAFMRSIPAAHIFSNIDLTFNNDTIALHDFIYQLGSSDFTINGEITNIRRALTRKRRNTLGIKVDIHSDTIDVNYLSALAMQGGEFQDIPENELEAERLTNSGGTQTVTVKEDTTEMQALVIPSNIDGELSISARNLLYTDFMFSNFHGDVRIKNSTAQLRDLAATSSIGKVNLTALYSAPNRNEIEFGMGMKVDRFHIERMIKLIPAIDSLMPMIKDFSGIINADLAATAKVDSTMNILLPSLQAALKLSGDSLVLLDADTFKSLSKWLFFKNKKHNMIDRMEVEMTIDNNVLEIYPFIFDIDRYRLGVMGSNDLAMNLNYHISVLKSPMPFKFGINIKGNVDNMKIRLGGAKFKNNTVIERVSIADTTRINLVNQIENIFRRSARSGLRLGKSKAKINITDEPSDTLSGKELNMLDSIPRP